MWWAKDVTEKAEEEAENFSIAHKDCLSSKELFELITNNLLHLEKVILCVLFIIIQ